jgi:uncharacterized SAM-binding protein YcdF (DUF218 family)
MYRLAADLLQPFFLLYLLTALLLLNLWRKRREDRRRLLALTLAFVLLGFCCVPATGYLALGSLEWPYPPMEQRPEDTQAIVVLAGYIRPAPAGRTRPEMGEDTLCRCLRGVEVYHQGPPCPILVSGGLLDAEGRGPRCAPLMRDFLVQMGVPASDVIVEDSSRTTWENAVQSGKLLEARGIRKIVLVTDAAHLFRAMRCFRKQGLDVVGCGCRYRALSVPKELTAYLPSAGGGRGLQAAWHEWLGTVWYWLQGRI